MMSMSPPEPDDDKWCTKSGKIKKLFVECGFQAFQVGKRAVQTLLCIELYANLLLYDFVGSFLIFLGGKIAWRPELPIYLFFSLDRILARLFYTAFCMNNFKHRKTDPKYNNINEI